VTPQQLAGVTNLSPDYFARLFKQTYGVIPRTWLVQEKMRLASVELVTTRKSITQVATELGYTDLYLFSRQFKQVCGCSPREFRLRHN
jgi:AraC-like DNA-binding protein